MKRKIEISEEKFNKIFKNPINEISYGKVENAYNKSEDVFWRLNSIFNDFYDELTYNADAYNPYIKKIKSYADAIDVILSSKINQHKKFGDELDKFDHDKFYDDVAGKEDYIDYGEMELRDLQNKYPTK